MSEAPKITMPEPAYWAEEHGTGKQGRRGIYRPQQAKQSGQTEFFFVYTADQMNAHALAAYRAGMEAAAQIADEFRRGAGNPVCGEVAAAIRRAAEGAIKT